MALLSRYGHSFCAYTGTLSYALTRQVDAGPCVVTPVVQVVARGRGRTASPPSPVIVPSGADPVPASHTLDRAQGGGQAAGSAAVQAPQCGENGPVKIVPRPATLVGS